MLDAAICLSIEQIGMLQTIDGLLAVLKFFSEECPREFVGAATRAQPATVFGAGLGHRVGGIKSLADGALLPAGASRMRRR